MRLCIYRKAVGWGVGRLFYCERLHSSLVVCTVCGIKFLQGLYFTDFPFLWILRFYMHNCWPLYRTYPLRSKFCEETFADGC